MATQQPQVFSDLTPQTMPTDVRSGFRPPVDQYGIGIQNVANLAQPPIPLVPETANKNVLSSSDANAFVNNATTKFNEGTSVQGTSNYDPAAEQRQKVLNASGVSQENPQTFDLGQEYRNIYKNVTAQKNKEFLPAEQQKAADLRSQTLASNVGQFATGQAGTTYGAMVMNDLAQAHARELDSLEKQKQDAINAQAGALQRGALSEYFQMQKAGENIKQNQQKVIDKYNQDQKDIAAAEKASIANEKLGREAASVTIGDMIKGGYTPTSKQLDYFDQKYGLDPGSSRVILGAAQADYRFKSAKDANDQQSAAIDTAKKISDYLDSRPLGSTVTIGGVQYIGTGKGNMKSGVQVDKATGQGLYYEFNPETGITTTTPMGTVGFNDPSWTIEKDNDGNLWRVNADTKQMEQIGGPGAQQGTRQIGPQIRIPLTPGAAQKTLNAILPEGTTGPALPGSQYAGQCGAYCNWAYGKGVFGNTIQEKTEALKRFPAVDPSAIQTNNTFVMKSGSTGHVGFVGDVVHDPDTGVLTGFMANESNMVPPNGGKLSYSRFVSINDPRLVGFADIPTPNLPQMGSDSVLTNVASGTEPSGYGVFGGKKATKDTEGDKLLTPSELKELNAEGANLTYGTTRAQAAAKGIAPSKVSSSTEIGALANSLVRGDLAMGKIPSSQLGAVLVEAEKLGYKAPGNATFRKMSDKAKDDFTSVLNLGSTLAQISNLKKNVDTGPIASRLESVKGVANAADPNFLDLKQKVSNVQAKIQQQISGAALSDAEVERLQKFIPNENDNDQVFNSKLKNLETEYKNILDVKAKLYGFKDTNEFKSAFGIDQPVISQETKPAQNPGTIRVKLKSSNQTGSIPEGEFDPAIYERI